MTASKRHEKMKIRTTLNILIQNSGNVTSLTKKEVGNEFSKNILVYIICYNHDCGYKMSHVSH